MGLLVICLRKLRVSLLASWEKQVSCPQTPLPLWWGGLESQGQREHPGLTLPSVDPLIGAHAQAQPFMLSAQANARLPSRRLSED